MKRFFEDTNGAVTVDWVVLTGALVGLGLAAMSVVSGGVEDLSTDTSNQLSSSVIKTSFGFTPDFSTQFNGEDITWSTGHPTNPEGMIGVNMNAATHAALIAEINGQTDAELLQEFDEAMTYVPLTNDAELEHAGAYRQNMYQYALESRGIPVPTYETDCCDLQWQFMEIQIAPGG